MLFLVFHHIYYITMLYERPRAGQILTKHLRDVQLVMYMLYMLTVKLQ